MTDRTSTLERVSSAMNGSESSDWLAALALAQISTGEVRGGELKLLAGVVDRGMGAQSSINAVGAHLTRLQTTTSQLSYLQARDSLAGLVRRLNQVRHWRLSDKHVVRVAESTLLMHLHPKCPHCHGQAYELVDGAPYQDESRPCDHCGGTGNRRMPKRHADEVAYVLNVLGLIQGLTERAVERRMR